MVRVCNYFDSQLHVPIPTDASPTAVNRAVALLRKVQADPDATGKEKRRMSSEEMLVWYGKILDAVRMRYRKLQRFAR